MPEQMRAGRLLSGLQQLVANVGIALSVGTVCVVAPAAQAQTFTLVTLHNFSGGTDGGNPAAGVVLDAAGNLYGTTVFGGIYGAGTVFAVDRRNNEKVLGSFANSYPASSLVSDAAGNFSGTTTFGGVPGVGTAYVVDIRGLLRQYHSFAYGRGDGAYPQAELIRGPAGKLYGTTFRGGSSRLGTIFQIDVFNREKVLYSFHRKNDGAYPHGGLVADDDGNFYGTTEAGGASGEGTVFVLTRERKERVLYNFGGLDGSDPQSTLVRDAVGNLFGTTVSGGAYGAGTVFMVTQSGQETVLHNFSGTDGEGSNPTAGLLRDASGNLYGTTENGGAFGHGTVFVVDTAGRETVLHSFSGGDGGHPRGALIEDAAGNLYGTTYDGGGYGIGTVFELIRH